MKSFAFVLLSTFVIGMLTGMYGYFIGEGNRSPFQDLFSGGGQVERGFEVVGDAYGGCQSLGCVSYRISDSGDYDVLISHRDGEDEQFDRSLSSRQQRELAQLLQPTTLERVSNSTFAGTCPIAFDGNAYRYQIRVDGVRYFIDTCKQNAASEQLFEVLEGYFEVN